jgi:hypothetical protein
VLLRWALVGICGNLALAGQSATCISCIDFVSICLLSGFIHGCVLLRWEWHEGLVRSSGGWCFLHRDCLAFHLPLIRPDDNQSGALASYSICMPAYATALCGSEFVCFVLLTRACLHVQLQETVHSAVAAVATGVVCDQCCCASATSKYWLCVVVELSAHQHQCRMVHKLKPVATWPLGKWHKRAQSSCPARAADKCYIGRAHHYLHGLPLCCSVNQSSGLHWLAQACTARCEFHRSCI